MELDCFKNDSKEQFLELVARAQQTADHARVVSLLVSALKKDWYKNENIKTEWVESLFNQGILEVNSQPMKATFLALTAVYKCCQLPGIEFLLSKVTLRVLSEIHPISVALS